MKKLSKHESQTGNGEEVGLFFRAPEAINIKRGELGDEDESPAHITFLYIGKVNPEDFSDLVEVSNRVLSGFAGPITFELPDKIDYFKNEDSWVAHQRFELPPEVSAIRKLLKETLIECGINVEDHYDEYVPHITLEYCPVGEYSEKEPLFGEWNAFGLEIWGIPYLQYVPFKIPLKYTASRAGGEGHNSRTEEEIFEEKAQKLISTGRDVHKRNPGLKSNRELRDEKVRVGDKDLDDGNRENIGGEDLSLRDRSA